MVKKMIDFDLDVYNALKDFPQNENHVYLYVRGSAHGQQEAEAVAGFSGSAELLASALGHAMKEKEEIVPALLGAVADFLSEKGNADYRNAFLAGLQENTKIKDE